MNCDISYSRDFLRDLKQLRKRHRSIDSDVANLIEDLRVNPLQGIDIEHKMHKIRIAISSKGHGKRGGARVITHVIVEVEDTAVKLLTIYDKTDKESVFRKQIA